MDTVEKQPAREVQGGAETAMLYKRLLQKWVNYLLNSPGARVFRRRVLLGGLFLLTLLVIMARLEEAGDTLVLQAGFPALTVNNNSELYGKLQRELLRLDLQPSSANSNASSANTSPRGIRGGGGGGKVPLVQSPLRMAALVAAQKHKWVGPGANGYQPELDSRAKEERHSTPSCQRLILDDPGEQERARAFMGAHQRAEKPPKDYIRETKNCSRFVEERGYIMSATAEEAAFPLAYSIMMYTGVEQAERMLRAIYRPHNFYCVHVDLKAPAELMQAMRGIADCLPNVFIASKLNKVYWATWSSLEALIFCMEDLWKMSKKWKYYINLTGQEFPLKTNLQLVRILTALNGSNIVDATTDPERRQRWYNNFFPPHGIVLYKGMVFMMACRGFIDYILHNQVAIDFLQWVRYTKMPDETFFPSLNHNPQLRIPGSYKGPPDTDAITKPYIARYVNWDKAWRDGYGRYNFRFPCYGIRVRSICIFGIGDLPLLTNRKELFLNKLYSTHEPMTFNCLEEWLLNMTIAEYAGHMVFNTSFYSSLDVVRNKVV